MIKTRNIAPMNELKEIRESLNLTQQEAANRAKVTIPTWSKLENGAKAAGALKRIAHAFRLKITICPNGVIIYEKSQSKNIK